MVTFSKGKTKKAEGPTTFKTDLISHRKQKQEASMIFNRRPFNGVNSSLSQLGGVYSKQVISLLQGHTITHIQM